MALDLKYGKVTLERTPESMTDDEPVFVLRAADALALYTIARYRNFAAQIEKPPAAEFFVGLDEVERMFREWKDLNVDRVKIPD